VTELHPGLTKKGTRASQQRDSQQRVIATTGLGRQASSQHAVPPWDPLLPRIILCMMLLKPTCTRTPVTLGLQ
jgi:hypothetical protein